VAVWEAPSPEFKLQDHPIFFLVKHKTTHILFSFLTGELNWGPRVCKVGALPLEPLYQSFLCCCCYCCCFAVLEFELRASCLLGRLSPPAPLCCLLLRKGHAFACLTLTMLPHVARINDVWHDS
jgi:hypothetical protein